MTTRKILAALSAASILAAALAAQKPETAESLMQTAVKKEVVDGNLTGAIEAYRKALAAAKGSRPIAAQALLHMAECYQKMGDAEARKIYEQVVRDYSDQKEAATVARARLGTAPQHAGTATRQVWNELANSVSNDGRFLAFTDKTGNLALHDVKAGEDRQLTKTGNWGNDPEYAGASVFSPVGNQVAYYWEHDFPRAEPRIEVRIVSVDKNASPRVRFFSEEAWALPAAWSPDGKWIAATLARKDKTRQIGLISTTGGGLRVLKSVDWRGPSRIAFSPDARYLAYDIPADQESTQRDVYVLAVDGSREIPAVVHFADDRVIGWTPDQKHLLFRSDRSGRTGVWALPFQDGKTGAPISVSSDFGMPLGVTRSGALYYTRRAGNSDIYTATVDLNTGRVLRAPVRAIERSAGFNNFCNLSRDGKQLAYVFMDNGEEISIGIRSMSTGETRILPRHWSRLISTATPRWAPDGRSLLAGATDTKGRNGTFRIDAYSGKLEPVTTDEKLRLWMLWAPDGKSFFCWYGDTFSMKEHNLASGAERTVFPGMCRAISRDGKYLACTPKSSGEWIISAVPVSGGEPKEVARVPGDRRMLQLSAWTPDGSALVYGFSAKERGKAELWAAPLESGKPRRIDLDLSDTARDLSIFPDGKQIVYRDAAVRGTGDGGVFVMENFLGTLSSKR